MEVGAIDTNKTTDDVICYYRDGRYILLRHGSEVYLDDVENFIRFSFKWMVSYDSWKMRFLRYINKFCRLGTNKRGRIMPYLVTNFKGENILPMKGDDYDDTFAKQLGTARYNIVNTFFDISGVREYERIARVKRGWKIL